MKQKQITLPGSQEVYQPGCEQYFSCNLKRLRLFRFPRLSQARLAQKLGVTRNTYAGYESGKRLPPAWFVCCTAELQEEADRIEYGNAHKGIHVTIHRISQPEESLVQSYSRITPPLLLLSKRIQSRVTDLLKDRRDGGKQTNLLMGRRINARAFAQETERYSITTDFRKSP